MITQTHILAYALIVEKIMTVDLTNVPDLERRQSLLAVIKQIEDVQSQMEAATKSATEARDAEYEVMLAEHMERLAPFKKAVKDASAPFEKRMDELVEIATDLGGVFADTACVNTLCSVSGLPIFDDDAVWEDSRYYGQRALQCLMPPVTPYMGSDDEMEEE